MPTYLRVLGLCSTLFLSGCIGIYDNTKIFSPAPYNGMDEGVMLDTYGTPAWSGFLEDQKVYTYRVRKTQYLLCVGLYDGFEYVITAKDGVVTKVIRTDRPEAFALLCPVPWAETD